MTRTTMIGLGTMGRRIAASIAATGHEVVGFDPEPEAREAARGNGVSVHGNVDEALAGAELVVLSLPRPEHVLELTHGPLSSVSCTIADMSTIDPGTAHVAARMLRAHRATYVDVPVLGRPDKVGHWTLPAGGQSEEVEFVRSVLEGSVAKAVIRVGEVGAGHTVKLLNNLMFGAINTVTAEVISISERSGLDPGTFVRTVAESGAATVSGLFKEIAPKMIEGDYDPAFSLGLLAKDNKLATGLAHEVGAPSFLADIVDQVNSGALEYDAELAKKDTGSVLEYYRSKAVNK